MSKIVKNVKCVYVFGNGKLSVGNGKNTSNDSPTISISKRSESIKLSSNLMNLDLEEFETIVLEFKNMEGFKVFEKMVKNTKKLLKEKQIIIG